jgi:hypothetical protein
MAKGIDGVETQLESLRCAMETRQGRELDRPRVASPEPKRLPVQLPMWPEPVRGGPNALLRSAFFAGIHSKKRQKLGIQTKPEKEPEGVTIAAQDGINIRYAGTQLNQYDADVFFEALHRARYHPLETECVFTGNSFLKAIGRTRNDLNYEDLNDSLKRLRNGTVEIEWKIKGRYYVFTGSLVSSYIRETTTKLYKVMFVNEIRTLFAPACWTQLEWDERMVLKGKPLAQWLHSYFSTHAAPFPVSVTFLHEKTGSPTKLLKHFKTELRNAFKSLHELLGWDAAWNGDLVTLTRPPSASQARHLIQNAHKQKQKRTPKRGEGGLTAASDLLPGLVKSFKIRNLT